MRSIRLRFLLSMLAFLCVVLSVFSYVSYNYSHDQLTTIYETTRDDQLARNKERQGRNQEHAEFTTKTLAANFDETLLLKAQSLVSRIARRVESRGPRLPADVIKLRPHLRKFFAGLHAIPTAPLVGGMGFFQWYTESRSFSAGYGTLSTELGRLYFLLELRDKGLEGIEEFPTIQGDQAAEYYQIYDEEGAVVHSSSSLAGQALPGIGSESTTNKEEYVRLDLYEHEFEDGTLAGGEPIRLVRLKAPVTQLAFVRPQNSRSRTSRTRRGGPEVVFVPGETDPEQRLLAPVVVVSFALSRSNHDEMILKFENKLQEEQATEDSQLQETLARLESQSEQELASLRNILLTISVFTLGVTFLGGTFIILRGLSPLRRIASAISTVSEKQFHLPLDPKEVPDELAPIVTKLQQSFDSLEHAFMREKQAAADISHELRTPIASLLTTAQVCLRKPRSSDEYRTALENCTQIGKQLNVLVEQLLLLARLDAGADKVVRDEVDLPKLVEDCADMVRPLAEARGLRLNLHKNGPISMNSDARKLREIITNLLHNAVQYNRENGSIDLTLGRHNGSVQVEVRDSGVGVSPEEKAQLFERFYRADPSRHSETTHAGLGLAIVKGCVDVLGGQIDVESEKDRGSTFRVSLPA